MNQNPFASSTNAEPAPFDGEEAPFNRTPFVLGAVGAWVAAAYWAALTALIGLGVVFGSVSAAQVILPIVLIGLYAVRGFQLFKGEPAAAKRLLWLHGAGAVFAVIQLTQGDLIVQVLQGAKLLVHLFGGVTAYLAYRASANAPLRYMT